MSVKDFTDQVDLCKHCVGESGTRENETEIILMHTTQDVQDLCHQFRICVINLSRLPNSNRQQNIWH